MATSGGSDSAMQHQEQQHYSSSPSLSSPPSALSEPGSPTRVLHAGRANIEMDEIIVDPSSAARFAIMQQRQEQQQEQQQHQAAEQAPSVPLTAAGLPRKKPGRKPGSTVKPKLPADGGSSPGNTANAADATKQQRRPRKPKDPNAPPVQRKRKAGATEGGDANSEMDARSAAGPPRQAKITELTPMRMALDARPAPADIGFAPTVPKRESASGSMNMMNLLNEEPQPKPQPAPPPPARQILKDALPPLPGGERSILDFGKARPGEEAEAPNISLHIPLNPGECNKYPRARARIAAATAALEKTGSGRDSSAEEMDEDILLHGSDAGESNAETPAQGKPAKKKRNFKEDEYDKDDDFVDDSELLWEEQAAASKDGFFVYSGPLIPEVEKPAASEDRPRRGRGGRGRGGRGGAGTARGDGSGRGRGGGGGGGPGSRGGGGGGGVRKPRITKLEKEQRDREKAERERLAQLASAAKTGPDSPASSLLSLAGPSSAQGATPSIAM
ncbi:hypothetical protein VTH06DRAFT_5491 [Thermothelomyces fergusii]